MIRCCWDPDSFHSPEYALCRIGVFHRHHHRHASRAWTDVRGRNHDSCQHSDRRSFHHLDPFGGGVYYGAIFGGSTSSILNALEKPRWWLPFDGYPMARRARQGRPLTIAANFLLFRRNDRSHFPDGFRSGPGQFCHPFLVRGILCPDAGGLVCSRSLCWKREGLEGIYDDPAGSDVSTVGESSLFNAPRFTLGLLDLQSGIHFVTLAMGLFAVPEAFFLAPMSFGERKEVLAGSSGNFQPSHQPSRKPKPLLQ